MDQSCTDESVATSDSTSTMISKSKNPKIDQEKLSRMGSGTSMIIDSVISNNAIVDVNNNSVTLEAESKKLPSSKYKGVVPQPNGRWGAQIYEKHQRVWLGTFNEEEEAARVYDIAAQRFRGRDAITNFKPLLLATEIVEKDVVEFAFLNSRSKAEIVDMLRKHTYTDELEQNRKNVRLDADERNTNKLVRVGGEKSVWKKEHLFEKILTPSDVGKLNRLVIPKQHAEKHFPLNSSGLIAAPQTEASKGVLLNFEDHNGKVWRFRYSYWNSSQSYVLTKGWSRFVKENGLLAGDSVSFERSTGVDGQLYIDMKHKNGSSELDNTKMFGLEPSLSTFRLFGVTIFKNPSCNIIMKSPNKMKRIRSNEDEDMLSFQCMKKKQRASSAIVAYL